MASERLCIEALRRFEAELIERPGVVGLGIVSADPSDPGGDELAVAVYVDPAVAGSEAAGKGGGRPRESVRIPDSLELEDDDKVLHRIPVRIIEQGPVELEMELPGLE
jgi:hypothetical protein